MHACPGHVGVSRRIEIFIRIDHIDHMMSHPDLFFGSGFRCADVHIPIDLHGISPDDFTTERLGHGNGHVGFADSGEYVCLAGMILKDRFDG